MAELMTYPVESPIEHNSKRFEPGDTIALDEVTAAPLITAGAIGQASVAASAKPAKAEELIALIKQAATVEEVDALLAADKRTTVIAAAEARRTELAG